MASKNQLETNQLYLTPLKTIRAKCLDCMAGSRLEVKLCPIPDCPNWIYRFGKNPHRKGVGNRKANIKTNIASSKTNTNSVKDLSD